MKPVDLQLPQSSRKCSRCSDVAVARGGWGLTARYCVIGLVRVAPLCLLAAFPGQVATLLWFN
jgi:hypothetical protein